MSSMYQVFVKINDIRALFGVALLAIACTVPFAMLYAYQAGVRDGIQVILHKAKENGETDD